MICYAVINAYIIELYRISTMQRVFYVFSLPIKPSWYCRIRSKALIVSCY